MVAGLRGVGQAEVEGRARAVRAHGRGDIDEGEGVRGQVAPVRAGPVAQHADAVLGREPSPPISSFHYRRGNKCLLFLVQKVSDTLSERLS